MKGILTVLCLTSLAISASVGQESYCYADIAEPNLYFATKTSYKFIKNTNTDLITLPGKVLLLQYARLLKQYFFL